MIQRVPVSQHAFLHICSLPVPLSLRLSALASVVKSLEMQIPGCTSNLVSQRLWGGARPAVFEGAPPRDSHTPQVLRTKPQRDESPELCVHLTASEGTSRWEFQNHQRKEEKSITGPKPGTSFLINILLRLWLPVSLLINLLVETLICERSNSSKQSERGRKSHHGAQSCSSEATTARSSL